MRTGMVAPCCLLLVSMAAFTPTAAAQDVRPFRPAWSVGGGGGAFLPQGDLAGHAGTNAAWELFLSHRPRAWGPWGARLTAQFVEHARSDTTFALPGIDVDTRTASSLVWWTLGPEVTVGGGPLRALGHAGVGVAWALTSTAVRTSTNDVGHTNEQDLGLAYEAGAALSWSFLRSDLMGLELGARWVGSGPLDYVPGSGIRRAAGALELSRRRDRLEGIVLRAALDVAIDRRWARH